MSSFVSSLVNQDNIAQINAVISFADKERISLPKDNRKNNNRAEFVYVSSSSQKRFFPAQKKSGAPSFFSFEKGEVVIILCRNGEVESLLADLFLESGSTKYGSFPDSSQGSWINISSSKECEVWEWLDASLDRGILPVHFGVNEEEKMFLLSFARHVAVQAFYDENKTFEDIISFFLNKKEYSIYITRFLTINAEVDVIVWCHGSLRGSRVAHEESLLKTVYRATLESLKDDRFKPLTKEELQDTRIEITLLSDLHMPLTSRIVTRNEIYEEKAYSLSKDGEKTWFVPATFNCVSFRDLSHLIDLLRSKSGSRHSDNSLVSICDVVDFIESRRNDWLSFAKRVDWARCPAYSLTSR